MNRGDPSEGAMFHDTTATPNTSPHDLALQQRINRSLLKVLESVKITLSSEAKRKHSVFLALSYKCFETAKSIGSLCDDNLYDDAFALLRVIVEGTINAVYILKSDDQVANDYMDYPQFQAWHQFEQIRSVAPELVDPIPPEDRAEMQAQFDKVRSRYEKHPNEWAKDNIFQRAKFIDTHLFPSLINVVWKDASAYVHSTARSIEWRIGTNNQVGASKTATKEEIATILFYSNAALFTLLAFLDSMTGAKIDRWKQLYDEWKQP